MTFGWEPRGQQLEEAPFKRLVPLEVLYELDSPMIFTFQHNERLFLAYMCGEGPGAARFLVVPSSGKIVKALRGGFASVREAVDQAWLWCVDVNPEGEVSRSWVTSHEELPANILPRHGVMLDPSHEPVFSVRVEGHELKHDRVPASAIKRAVDGAYIALKKLSETSVGGTTTGRPAKAWKQLFDLPAQRVAIGSFEIEFRAPHIEQENIPGIEGVQDQLTQLANEFCEALNWAVSERTTAAPRLQLLEAMEKLVPPQHGSIERVHIGGRLFGAGRAAFTLDRTVSKRVRLALAVARAGAEEIKNLSGEPRELDKDKFSFRLHDEGSGSDFTCFFQEDMYDDVMDAFAGDERITVTLRLKREALIGDVVVIAPLEQDGSNDDGGVVPVEG